METKAITECIQNFLLIVLRNSGKMLVDDYTRFLTQDQYPYS